MTPNMNEFLTTVVLVSFVVTVVLAIGSYLAYKVRERRRAPSPASPQQGPVFFERFVPPDAKTDHARDDAPLP